MDQPMLPPQSSNPKAVLESTAIHFLSYRPRFTAEVINRLVKKAKELGLADSPTLINQIIASLEKSGFLDDKKLLESYIRSRLVEKKKGPYWIRQHLVRFGLSKFEIDAALAKFADKPSQLAVIRNYLEQYLTIDLKTKAGVFRRLVGRGFSASLVAEAFDER
ncbi:MAG: RecX family transcriptional regulator [Patescibacteria group bacterium]